MQNCVVTGYFDGFFPVSEITVNFKNNSIFSGVAHHFLGLMVGQMSHPFYPIYSGCFQIYT